MGADSEIGRENLGRKSTKEQQLTEEISGLDEAHNGVSQGWGERAVHPEGTNREFVTEEDLSVPRYRTASSGGEQCGRT